jgi:hypothetical protein
MESREDIWGGLVDFAFLRISIFVVVTHFHCCCCCCYFLEDFYSC